MLRDIGFGLKFLKDYNELNVLRFIKNNNYVSRATIARKYKISKAAVSDIVCRLVKRGFVNEVGVGNSTTRGGRKPVLLQFNQLAGYAIGVEIKRSFTAVALLDLEAHIHEVHNFEYPQGTELEYILNKVINIINEFRHNDWLEHAIPLGIGIAVPGIIDYESGSIQVSDTLKKWVGFPIRDYLTSNVGVDTFVENDVKARTLGEGIFGIGKDYSNLVYLWIGDGIGAGLIINGNLIRGITSSAGEIGYDELGFFVKDIDNYSLLYQGQKDFGDILSNKILIRAAQKAIHDGFKTHLNPESLSIEKITEAAEQHDQLACELIKEFGYLLGVLCINLVNLLNMELLIIGGNIVQKKNLLLEYLREKVDKDLLSTPAQAVKIVAEELRENGGVLGAGALVLQDLFYQDRINVIKYRDVFKNIPDPLTIKEKTAIDSTYQDY